MATVTPAGAGPHVNPAASAASQADLGNLFQQAGQIFNDVVNGFSDEEPVVETATPSGSSEAEAKKASDWLKSFMSYVQGDKFKSDINCTAKQYGVPPKKLAENFLTKCLGTVGDILGVAISTVGNVGHTIVNVLSAVVHGAVDVVVSVFHALARVVTLNKTNIVSTAA